ncbi:energy transducer TonB [Leptothrix discophora]|uniref:Energy transducer TonB n=1 Tax=Leptothrix discophora TaxID=89 RepID=A0ABT9G5P1_LEPDI|nr:energy transducer TonB [Leptothrix discophora]MDP4301503.1 energy transducer TonB [Leptothrix discophora]
MSTASPFDPLGPRGRIALVITALAAHVTAGVPLWWQRPAPSTPASLALLQVDWVEAPVPHPAPVMPKPAMPKPVTPMPVMPMPMTPAPPRPVAEPARPVWAAPPVPAAPAVLAAAPSADPAPAQALPAVAQPLPPSMPSTMPSAMQPPMTPQVAAPSATAAPHRVTLSATDWVRPPVYAYPREAQRRREQGVVAVRILFDTQGVPRQVSLLRSSGSAALDDEALAKARGSRARPRLQDGVPVEFLADTEAEFKF